MCRNIRTLFNFDPPATDEEIHASALQFVRKLSGFTEPSKANEPAFSARGRGGFGCRAPAAGRAGHGAPAAQPRRRSDQGARAGTRAVRIAGRMS